MKVRKFSVPYNGINPDIYLSMIEPYKNNIDNIFFGVSSLINNHQVYIGDEKLSRKEYENNTFSFLEKSKGKYKRILTLNSGHYYFKSDLEMTNWCNNILFPFIEKYNIDGCIITNYNMGRFIHLNMPNLELHTSCNCFQWNIRQMEIWQKDCGISVFNPPREILRSPQKLKEMHDAGFKLKCLINENCLFGCPQTINHCISLSCNQDIVCNCTYTDIDNYFKGNFVLPRWLNQLDEYVDIYKITGRCFTENNKYLPFVLESYINSNEVDDIRCILIGGLCDLPTLNPIPSMAIPDKLLTCECKECNKTCFICRDLAEKYIKRS